MSSPETGISEYNVSDDLEESEMRTSAGEPNASLPTDLSIETEGMWDENKQLLYIARS